MTELTRRLMLGTSAAALLFTSSDAAILFSGSNAAPPAGPTGINTAVTPSVLANATTGTVICGLIMVGGVAPPTSFAVIGNNNIVVSGTNLVVKAGASFTAGVNQPFSLTVTDSGSNTYTDPPASRTLIVPAGPTAIAFTGTTIIDNSPQGTLVGLLSSTGGTFPFTYTCSNSKFQINGVRVERSGTGTITAGSPESLNFTSTDAGGASTNTATNGQGPYSVSVTAAGAGTLVYTFQQKNWNAATTPAYFRIGMNFPDGNAAAGGCPPGNNLTVQNGASVIPSQFDEFAYYPSGNLQNCVAHIRDDSNSTLFNSLESRTYQVYTQTGSFNNTGTKTIADITGAHTYEVDFDTVTQYNGTTTVTRGSGAFTSSAATVLGQTLSGQATRLTKVHSGPICETWWAWGMATDNTGGAEDKDLKAYWEISIWKKSDGTIFDIEYAAILAQDWWGAPSGLYSGPKYRLNYNATLKLDGSTVQAYNTIQHPYKSWWITCDMSATTNSGRRQWASGTIPTLQYIPNLAYWVNNGLIPPLNLTGGAITFGTSTYTATYVPCHNVNVNADIAQTGGSNGRGPIMDSDIWYLLSQRPVDLVNMRRSALSGLGVPYHYRSNDTRTRPGTNAATTIYGGDNGVSDIASTQMPVVMSPLSPPQYDFTAQGMPASFDAFSGGSSSVNHNYVTPQGGTGVWSTDDSHSAHGASYCYATYLLEGEHHFLEVMMDLATNTVQQQTGNSSGGILNYIFYNNSNYQVQLGIPATVYHGVGPVAVPGNTRGTGWGLCIYSEAAAICPTAHPAKTFLLTGAAHNLQYIVDSMGPAGGGGRLFQYVPDSQINAGWYTDLGLPGSASPSGAMSPWMHNFIVMGLYMSYLLLKDTNAKFAADNWLANLCNTLWASHLYRTTFEKLSTLPSNNGWTPGTNEFWSEPNINQFVWNVSIATGSNLLTGLSAGGSFNNPTGMYPRAGDPVYVSEVSFTSTAGSPPSELTLGTRYYATNVTGADVGMTFQLATAADYPTHGSLVTFGSNYASVYLTGISSNLSTYTYEGQSGSWITGPDSYAPIARAAAVLANKVSPGIVGSGTVNTAQTFCQLIDSKNVANTGPAQHWVWYWA